jgi:hypothetical protein
MRFLVVGALLDAISRWQRRKIDALNPRRPSPEEDPLADDLATEGPRRTAVLRRREEAPPR